MIRSSSIMNKIIKRIKNLLDLANDTGTTIHEAELALKKSYELMNKYHLTLEDISRYTEEGIIVEEVLFVKKRLSVWDKYILDILQTFFHVRILKHPDTYQYILVGTNAHIEISKRIYEYLKEIFKASLKQYKRIHKRAQPQSYYFGLYCGLYSKLEQSHISEQEKTSIVLYESVVQKYLETKCGIINVQKQPKVKLYDRNAYLHGEQDGGRINIFTPITSEED